MDLNPARRKRERAIAHEVEEEFLREITSTEAAPPELLAHHFGLVCERLNVLVDEAAAGRVLGYVLKTLARKHRQVDRIKMDLCRVLGER